jgi:pimeloyl-ACP methyl ester carboxylesterase
VGLAPITDLESAAAEGPGQEAATDILSRGAPTITIGQQSDIFLLHGGHDQLVSVKHSTRLEAAARVEVIDDSGHFELLDPARAHWPLVLEALTKAFS